MSSNPNPTLNFFLTDKFKKKNFYLKPFPHLIIENALPNNIYEVLDNNFPKYPQQLDQFDNSMFTVDDTNVYDDKESHEYWKQILRYLSSSEYFSELNNIFGEHLTKHYSKAFKLIELIDKLSVKDNNEEIGSKIISNSRVMFFSPVKKRGIPKKPDGSNLEVHCDGASKLFTSILYFKDKNDKSSGGELLLHKWRFKVPLEIKKIILASGLNFINTLIRSLQFLFIKKNKIIKYKENCLVIFFGTENALHSVNEREEGSLTRRSIHAGIHYNEQLWDGVSFIDKCFNKLKHKREKLIKYLNLTKFFQYRYL